MDVRCAARKADTSLALGSGQIMCSLHPLSLHLPTRPRSPSLSPAESLGDKGRLMARGPKPAKSKEAKPPAARKSAKADGTRVRDLEKRLAEALKREAEGREQQIATSEILRVISQSPTDFQPVFDTIVSNADAPLGQIQADERKVRQVVLNLLSNAIKFTPEGGRIDVGAMPKDGFVEVSVTDTGIGIAPEDQEKVFEEFRQVGTAAKTVEGTGLGLTLCRKFVELHGGKIWVKSEVGMGSTFTLTIPVRLVN